MTQRIHFDKNRSYENESYNPSHSHLCTSGKCFLTVVYHDVEMNATEIYSQMTIMSSYSSHQLDKLVSHAYGNVLWLL